MGDIKQMIDKYKQFFIRTLRGYDSSLKVKGSSLFGILQDIDRDNSISDDEIKRKYNIFFNNVVLQLRRTNQHAKLDWLNSSSATILKYLYVYKGLMSSLYSVDDSLLEWYRKNNSDDGSDLDLLDSNDLGHILFTYNNELYSAELFEANNTISTRHVSISNVCIPQEASSKDSYVSYAFDYDTFPHEEDEFFHHENRLSVICSNKSCPRWRQSLATSYEDGGKHTSCSLKDCQSCEIFNSSGVLRPMDALTIVKAIYKCVLTREYKHNDSNTKEVDYEHVPLPQRDDDVIIYFGRPKKKRSLEELGLVPISGDYSIVSSHASPREHHRRGGNRKSFTRVVNGKVQNVRATTFKETTVCKGNTKTTYKLKERK